VKNQPRLQGNSQGSTPDLLDGLPMEDQDAISEAVGSKVLLSEYDELGRAELQFTAKDGLIHFIWVDPKFLTPAV
jgi:hypothetical protein